MLYGKTLVLLVYRTIFTKYLYVVEFIVFTPNQNVLVG